MSRKIKEIPAQLVSKIAAGEVITRPVDVVKELIENSLDANATKISATIENGGQTRIIVEDNGEGILPEDMELAFKLHTSSKISEERLFNVGTLGFRGEALSSIAIVSKVKCISSVDGKNAMEIVLEGGKVLSKKNGRRTRGTKIEVSAIFFNVPARRKFLRSAETEKRLIRTLITHFALIHPNVHFELLEKKGNRTTHLLQAPSRMTKLATVFDVLGNEIASQLIPLSGQAGRWKIEGFISIPSYTKRDRSLQYVSVNKRIVRSGDINSAIEEGYGAQLLKGHHPAIIVDLVGKNEWVDYNVHPQKLEVRFDPNDNVLEELAQMVKDTLEKESHLPELTEHKAKGVENQPVSSPPEKGEIYTAQPIQAEEQVERYTQYTLEDMVGSAGVAKSGAVKVAGGYRILGHIMNKFALIETDTELWIMDVHAADERVKFEQYENIKSDLVMSQSMLTPVKIKVDHEDFNVLDEIQPLLKSYGLEISTVPETTVLVHSIPVYFDQTIDRQTISNVLQGFAAYFKETSEKAVTTPLDELQYKVVARLACHGAVRSGYPVSNHKLAEILNNLLKCKYPWTCAHGRPTVIRIKQGMLESWFKRVGQ